MLSKAVGRLTNPIVRPASGSIRFIFKPVGMIAAEVFIAFVFTVVPWVIALGAVPEGWRGPLFLAGVPLVVLAMHRAFRVSVVADNEGLTVKNYWRTIVLPWSEIAAVTLSTQGIGASYGTVVRTGVRSCIAASIRDCKT